MRLTFLLLELLVTSLALFPNENVYLTEPGEDTAPIQMARLRKNGVRKDGSCTNEGLRKIMHESMTVDTTTEVKRAVHRAVTASFDGSYGILCAECAFSYIVHTIEYCVHTRHNITCLIYKDA